MNAENSPNQKVSILGRLRMQHMHMCRIERMVVEESQSVA